MWKHPPFQAILSWKHPQFQVMFIVKTPSVLSNVYHENTLGSMQFSSWKHPPFQVMFIVKTPSVSFNFLVKTLFVSSNFYREDTFRFKKFDRKNTLYFKYILSWKHPQFNSLWSQKQPPCHFYRINTLRFKYKCLSRKHPQFHV